MPTPTNLVTYQVNEQDGTLERFQGENADPETIADYDPKTGVLELREGFGKYRIAAIRHLNDKGWLYKGLSQAAVAPDDPDVPPRPRKNPRIGDKTPAYVEWMARYRREEFLVTFAVKSLQHRTGWDRWTERIRGEDGHWIDVPQEEPIYEDLPHMDYDVDQLLDGRQRLIADRTSVITLKLADNNDDEYDWDIVQEEMAGRANDHTRRVRA